MAFNFFSALLAASIRASASASAKSRARCLAATILFLNSPLFSAVEAKLASLAFLRPSRYIVKTGSACFNISVPIPNTAAPNAAGLCAKKFTIGPRPIFAKSSNFLVKLSKLALSLS